MNPAYYIIAEHPCHLFYERYPKGQLIPAWGVCTWRETMPLTWRKDAAEFIEDIRSSYVEAGESHRFWLARLHEDSPNPAELIFRRLKELACFSCDPAFDTTLITPRFGFRVGATLRFSTRRHDNRAAGIPVDHAIRF